MSSEVKEHIYMAASCAGRLIASIFSLEQRGVCGCLGVRRHNSKPNCSLVPIAYFSRLADSQSLPYLPHPAKIETILSRGFVFLVFDWLNNLLVMNIIYRAYAIFLSVQLAIPLQESGVTFSLKKELFH